MKKGATLDIDAVVYLLVTNEFNCSVAMGPRCLLPHLMVVSTMGSPNLELRKKRPRRRFPLK
jgi:hypothetical protein